MTDDCIKGIYYKNKQLHRLLINPPIIRPSTNKTNKQVCSATRRAMKVNLKIIMNVLIPYSLNDLRSYAVPKLLRAIIFRYPKSNGDKSRGLFENVSTFISFRIDSFYCGHELTLTKFLIYVPT